MPAAQSLKEYLVRLGWDVDELGLKKAENLVGSFENTITSLGNKFISSFAQAGISIGKFIYTTSSAIAKLTYNVAQADLATEQFARRMWTTESQARSFLSAMDAMDVKNIVDIYYMTPEQYRNLLELKNLASQLAAPKELNDTLKQIRDIGQEFNKTKIIINYATQWIAYYIGQYLGKDIKSFRDLIANINEYLIKHLPSVTEKIARFFVIIYKAGKSAIQVIQFLWDVFKKLFDKMPSGMKGASAAIAGFLLLLKSGPIGIFIATLTALFLLLDDFLGWQQGKKSAFDWDWLQNLIDFGKDSNIFDGLSNSFGKLWESAGRFLDQLKEIIIKVYEFLDKHDVLEKSLQVISDLLNTMADAASTLLDLLTAILGGWDKLPDSSAVKQTLSPIKEQGANPTSIMDVITRVVNRGMYNNLSKWIDISGQSSLANSQYYRDLQQYVNSLSNGSSVAASTTSGGRSGKISNAYDNRRQTVNNVVNVAASAYGLNASQLSEQIIKSLNGVDVLK
mgnify:CR=1 FL=1